MVTVLRWLEKPLATPHELEQSILEEARRGRAIVNHGTMLDQKRRLHHFSR